MHEPGLGQCRHRARHVNTPFHPRAVAERDEERLEELRALNRANFEETGEYMSEVGPH
jgi:hypothetical protein